MLCPYANAYSGYVTTFEEYQLQLYEGGHCLFGQWSLAALQTAFKRMIQDESYDSVDYQSDRVLPSETVAVNEDDSLRVCSTREHLRALES